MDYLNNIFNTGSGSSDSEDDVDYVPPTTVESDHSEDELSDEEAELYEEPATKKAKLNAQELKNNDAPTINKPTVDVWQSFLKGVRSTPYGKANGKQNEASTSEETSKPKTVNKIESANSDKAAEATDIKVPDESDADLKKEETLPKEKELESNVEKLGVSNNSVELKDDAPEDKNDVVKDKPINILEKDAVCVKDKPVDVLIARPRTGLSSVLGSLANKGKKQSVLEKSLEDWKTFKEEHGIEKDLETFNKGRSGYIERQRFLERSDIRSFENEKNLRLTGRKLPGSTGK
ncbi:craniofacial development protein 1 [Parasteatoda tepidariorum]|uniref:craniofacial development protein 1 n=1 Tax=Parasteatoda tepidariorum TaxID=114398 RepID=UPI00077FCFD0|nr:craniofacial development protein 1 [Parasteatoda tepidariorum]